MVRRDVLLTSISSYKEVSFTYRFKRTGKRNKIFLATKFGIVGDPDRATNGEPEYVVKAFEKSCRNLGVDFVDLYYFHR